MVLMLITAETAPFAKPVKAQHVRSAKLVNLAKRPVAKVQHVRSVKLVRNVKRTVAKENAETTVIVIVIAEEKL